MPNPDPANPPMVDNRLVTESYLSTLGIPLLRGRDFTAGDKADALPVAEGIEADRQHVPVRSLEA